MPTDDLLWPARLATARAIECEALRALVLQEVSRTGLREVARQIRTSRGSLRRIVAGATPTEESLELLRIWRAELRPYVHEEVLHPGTAGIATIAAEVPSAIRARVRREVAAAVRDAYAQEGLCPPTWVLREME